MAGTNEGRVTGVSVECTGSGLDLVCFSGGYRTYWLSSNDFENHMNQSLKPKRKETRVAKIIAFLSNFKLSSLLKKKRIT